jgi:hypothetical protein
MSYFEIERVSEGLIPQAALITAIGLNLVPLYLHQLLTRDSKVL